MGDPLFLDSRFTELYDSQAAWKRRREYCFYMELVMSAGSVLDVGCGTGELLHLAREAGHTGRLCGVDPADAMLQHARTRPDVEWILGDAASAAWDQEFDLVVMTGHAIQAIIDDENIKASLAAIRSALTEQGRFVVETRNPTLRAWEKWTPDHVSEFFDPNGALVRTWYEIDTVDGDVVTVTSTYASSGWNQPRIARSSLRFLDLNSLNAFLSDAGLAIEEQFGDWDRQPLTDTSPEIITIARRV